MDESLANWLHEHATPGLTEGMRAITILGSPAFVALLTIVAIAMLLVRRDQYSSMQLAIGVAGGMLINTGLKNIFDRSRPHFEPALTHAYGYSFPSGHVAAATLLYGALLVLAWRRIPATLPRIMFGGAVFLLVQLISLSRMYLSVHYLTDVIVAQFVGIVWLALTFTGAEIIRRRRLSSSHSVSTGLSS